LKGYEMLISSLLSSGLTSNIADFFKLMGFRFQQILNENILIKAKKWWKEKVDLWRILKATDQRFYGSHQNKLDQLNNEFNYRYLIC